MEILPDPTSNKLLVAGNPVKEILLKLNLPDHKSILTDSQVTPTKHGRMTKPYSSPRFIANCFNAGHLKMEVKYENLPCEALHPSRRAFDKTRAENHPLNRGTPSTITGLCAKPRPILFLQLQIDGKGSRLFKAWQLNIYKKNSSISSKPDRAYICRISGAILPTTTTMFIATTFENTPLAYRASTSTKPNPVISPAFVEANYETLESLLRDRRRQMRNNNLRTKLEYFNEDYDEEREMEPRLGPARAVTPPLRAASPRVRRRRERVVGFEETQNRGESRVKRNNEGGRPLEEAPRGNGSQNANLPPLLASHIGRSENGQPLQSFLTSAYGGQALSNNIGGISLLTDYPLPDGLKMPSHIGSYDRKGDLDNFLHLFKGAIRKQKCLMPVACHMFTYTLKYSARIWWSSQKAGRVLDYKDLKAKFQSHFSQQNKFTKTRLAVHNTKQRENKNLPLTYKGLMEKTYTWVEAKEVATNGVSSDRRDSFERPKKSSWDNNRGQKNKDRGGVFCYGKMPFGLKNARATYQRLVDKVFSKQIRRNLESYVDDMVIKSISEEGMLSDIQETFERFRSINMKLNLKKCSFSVEEGSFLRHLIIKQGIKANPLKIKAVIELEQPRALKDIQSLNGKPAALSRFLSKRAERSLPFFKVLKGCKGKKKIHWTDEADKAFKEIKKFVQDFPTLTAPRAGETLIMHLAASKESINAALFAKEVKGRSPSISKKASKILSSSHDNGSHRDERETLADFLPEIPFDDNEKRVKEKEVSDPSNEWKLYTDGASSFDGAGAKLMLIDLTGKEYTYALRFKFERTNNEAEYEALLAGLRIAHEMKITKVAIFLDSQLVVNQIKGTYAVKQMSIKSYLQKVKTALKGFEGYTVVHVRRNQNKKADVLIKLALMTFEHLTKVVLVEVLAKRSIEENEVLKVEIEEKRSWMSPIQEYLLSCLLPEDTKEARKISIQVPHYKLIRSNLYKRSFFTPWLRCIARPQTNKIIKEIHEGSCGFNVEPRSMVVRITKQGYYWPSMHMEAAKIIQDCNKCKE
uniref:Reverse transcriptase domain-containing protein n=1 Tax=Tanacetum cinerariifolium TaxID=118510 RepID=A0A6L2KYL7_TANCI|nr:reverse transcriptase domain-containing protein [Tanacetum cinerariifolium]